VLPAAGAAVRGPQRARHAVPGLISTILPRLRLPGVARLLRSAVEGIRAARPGSHGRARSRPGRRNPSAFIRNCALILVGFVAVGEVSSSGTRATTGPAGLHGGADRARLRSPSRRPRRSSSGALRPVAVGTMAVSED
jgi:hypothetical protein